jgi:hypothetical protein
MKFLDIACEIERSLSLLTSAATCFGWRPAVLLIDHSRVATPLRLFGA